MSSKNKKGKGHKSKLSDDMTKELYNDKNNPSINTNNEVEDFNKKRHHTKVSRHKKKSSNEEIIQSKGNIDEKCKKVKFSGIDVIKVECWKKYNLKLTAEENFEELMNISSAKKEKEKNISCTCLII